MYLSEQLKLLLVHIPHTGGVSFKATFSDYSVENPGAYFTEQHLIDYVKNKLVFPPHITMSEIQQVVNIDTSAFSKLTIVRNPWTRYASLWLSVKRNNQHPLTVFANSNSFKRFLEKLVNNELGFDMKNQLHFLVNQEQRIELDAVIRFESYDADVLQLANELGVDISIQQAEGRRKNPERTDYFGMFGDYEKKLVEAYCEAEIELFKYRFGE